MRIELNNWNLVRRFFVLVFAFLLGAMVWLFVTHDGQEQYALSTDAVQRLMKDTTVVLIDVRTDQEFRSETGRIRGAVHIPVQELAARLPELESYKDRQIVVYCRTQNRSRMAADLLRNNGFNALFMLGGIVNWNREHKPVIREGE